MSAPLPTPSTSSASDPAAVPAASAATCVAPGFALAFVGSVLALLLAPFLRVRWGETMVEAARIGVLAPATVLVLAGFFRLGGPWRRVAWVFGALLAATLLSWGVYWTSLAGATLAFGGIGAGLALGYVLADESSPRVRLATVVFLGVVGVAMAVWMFFEDRNALWKLVPTRWEILKNLEYKEGIRHGLGRARATLDHTTTAAVWQWFTGTILLLAAWAWLRGRLARGAALLAAGICFASIVPTLARAGLLLTALTAILALAQWFPWGNRRRLAWIAVAALAFLGGAAAVHKFVVQGDRPWLRSFTSIASTTETGNAERLDLMWQGLLTLPEVPWNGWGLDSITPRFPERAQVNFENTYLSITHALGLSGALWSLALLAGLAWSAWRAWLALERGREPIVVLSLLLGPPLLAYTFLAPCLWYWGGAFLVWGCVGVVVAAQVKLKEAGSAERGAGSGNRGARPGR